MHIDLNDLPNVINPVYLPLLSNQSRYLLLFGSAGSGKSVFAVQKILIRILLEKNHRVLVIRKIGSSHRVSTFKLFKDIIDQWGLSQLVEINKTELTITFKDFNSEIMFRGIDDPEKIKSIAGITVIFCEEVTELAEEDLNQLDTRLRGITASYKQIIMAFNPISADHWLKEKYFDNPSPQLLDKTTILKSTYRDNRFIDQEYKEILEAKTGNDRLVYCEGEWGIADAGGRAYKSFEFDKHVKKISFNSGLPLHLSFDQNLNPYITLIITQLDPDRRFFNVIDEICLETPLNSIKDLCFEFKKRVDNGKYNCDEGLFIHGDVSGNKKNIQTLESDYTQIFRELSEYNPENRVSVSNPSVKTRIDFINRVFADNLGGIKIQIDESCFNLIQDLLYCKNDENGGKLKERFFHKKSQTRCQKYGHTSDAFDYVFIRLFSIDYNKFSSRGGQGNFYIPTLINDDVF